MSTVMHQKSSLINEIYHLNLSYLLLVQRIADDEQDYCFARLGIAELTLHEIKKLSLEQLTSLANTGQLLMKLRMDDPDKMLCITEYSRVEEFKNIHLGILLAGSL